MGFTNVFQLKGLEFSLDTLVSTPLPGGMQSWREKSLPEETTVADEEKKESMQKEE